MKHRKPSKTMFTLKRTVPPVIGLLQVLKYERIGREVQAKAAAPAPAKPVDGE